jgi:hypothetical protein
MSAKDPPRARERKSRAGARRNESKQNSRPHHNTPTRLRQARHTAGQLVPISDVVTEVLVETYAATDQEGRRRMRELALTSPSMRRLHAALMREARRSAA